MAYKIYFNIETRQFSTIEDRQFGLESKALAVFAPGAWTSKEAAKYMYDNHDDYMKNRRKEAWKGAFSPISSARRLERAKTMHEMGATPKQIRESLDKRNLRNSGVVGQAVGLGGYRGHILMDAMDPNRKKFNK